MTNDTKCHFEINVINIHKNIKIKINVKNDSHRDVHVQIHDAHKINKNKYTQTIKNKTMTINTKCHFKLNVTFMNKSIEIKIKITMIEVNVHKHTVHTK
jgi:hypothetical protein